MVKIPKAVKENQERIIKSREILTRMNKGEKIIKKSYEEKSIALSFEAIRLYGTLARELFALLEQALMFSEYSATGRTIMITREGKAINIAPQAEGEVEIDPWSLLTMEKLRAVFGDEVENMIEFKEAEQE